MVVREELVTYGDSAEEVIQVLEPVYRAFSMAWFISLVIALALVKTILLVPRVISPVKVVAFWVA